MNLEPSYHPCPLCKRASSTNGDAPGTRLCEQCRGIVQAAFQAPRVRPFAQAGANGNFAAQELTANDVPISRDQQVDVPCFFDDTLSPSEFGDTETGSRVEPTSQHGLIEARDTSLFQDAFDAPMFDLDEFPQADVSPKRPSESLDDEPPEHNGHEEQYTNVESVDPTSGSVEPDLIEASTIDLRETAEDGAPLQAWDYSGDHWPVVAGPSEPKAFSRAKTSMVILTLAGCAAAFYFLIYQPSTSAQRGIQTSSASSTAPAATPTSNRASGDAPAPVSSSALDSNATADRSPAARDVVSKTDPAGRFSLQAAAFPTQAGADEFAEKLKRAGVPSFVMSADMGRRGTWYRVRVGRFESAEAARQYSIEAQLRGKAAGVSLQLIVCQYEQQ